MLGYNVRSLRDDRRAVARVIAACSADVVCVQEAPRLLLWRTGRRALARDCRLKAAVSRRTGGLAILVRPDAEVVHTEHHVLRRYPGLHVRAVTMAVVELSGHRIAVASTHLDLAPGPRLQHAAEVLGRLNAMAAAHGAPPLLAGDVNEEPGGPAWRLLTADLRDAAAEAPWGEPMTFTARRPRRRIDAVFTGAGLTPLRAGVPTALVTDGDAVAASDHRPVLAEIGFES
ncbi:endonuclease/exonuclease/phosphatase family protein [Spinactinospora alkalitolerans]